jgi:pyrroloquinoline quinone biosynthesis protein D
MTDIEGGTRPRLGRGFRLQWEPAQNTHVLLFPEGMIKLNGSASEILKRCDGEATLDQINADLEQTFNKPGLMAEVLHFVNFALEKRWLELQ